MESGSEGATLDDHAIHWVVRLNSGRAGPADRALFESWRRTSPEHERAAGRAEALWRDVGRLPRSAAAPRAGARPMLGRRAVLGGALAAGGAMAIWSTGLVGTIMAGDADYATAIGERRVIALADGSAIDLDAASAVSVEYGGAERRIALHRGRAVFRVVRDARRPFVVAAGDGETRVVGTTFQVDRHGAGVTVSVVEGMVEVRGGRADEDARQAARLGAGRKVAYGPAGLSAVEAVDVAAATAWRRGKLVFERRPLREVVAELERYRAGRIVILDPEIARLEVTGIFDLADPDGLLRAIEVMLPVTVNRFPLLTVIR